MKPTLFLFCTFALSSVAHAQSAKLDEPYEAARHRPPPFGIVSYYNQPWRGYMDTWPAKHFLGGFGSQYNQLDPKVAPPLFQLMQESGITNLRLEIGWDNIGWDDDIKPERKDYYRQLLEAARAHGIRPLILLNAHHGSPGPLRDVRAELRQDAKAGERALQFAPNDAIRPGTTGLSRLQDGVAAFPLITQIDANGTAQLSAPLPTDLKAGTLNLIDLKYQPFQDPKLEDGTPVPASAETFNGWLKYAAAVGTFVRSVVGTPTDAGFDIEVWNEQTFGSNFLDINNYYQPKRQYAEKFVYRKTRAWTTALRPDAKLEFAQPGFQPDAGGKSVYNIVPMTVDYFADRQNNFPGVKVVSGFSNQWPWDSGALLWPGQAGFSRHYYTGDYGDISPANPVKKGAAVNALGEREEAPFVPSLHLAFPEYFHSGFKTENSSRDLSPDSRDIGIGDTPHGRFVNNGDRRRAQWWQTETEWDRGKFIRAAQQAAGAKDDDPRVLNLAKHTASKMMLRQFLFHNHKGFDRIYLYSLQPQTYRDFGLLTPDFYAALEKNNYQLNDAARALAPDGWRGMAWLNRQLQSAVSIENTRALRVEELIEEQPRLVFAGDGTAAHPNVYNRDWFAFLPYQLSANKFAVPYYVVTPDVTKSYDDAKNALDPARYDLPEQQFEIVIANVNGRGAKVSAFDPITQRNVLLQVLGATNNRLRVRLATTDTPRVLMIEEAAPGPLIEAPQVLARGQNVTVSWNSNAALDSARVSYGRNGRQRDANALSVKTADKNRTYSVTFPAGDGETVAARIEVSANGLSAIWPQWDEDGQGQITLPNAKPRAAGQSAPVSTVPAIQGASLSLPAPDEKQLPRIERHAARYYTLRLPQNVVVSGPNDERTFMVGEGENSIALRAQFVAGGAKNAGDYLPFTAVGDESSAQNVTLSDGTAATLVGYDLAATAHPGEANLRRKYLLVPLGENRRDLLVLSASGKPQAMRANDALVRAIFGGVQIDATKS